MIAKDFLTFTKRPSKYLVMKKEMRLRHNSCCPITDYSSIQSSPPKSKRRFWILLYQYFNIDKRCLLP